jgi:Methylase involved in ubiquinone/menaquinone biosynthesis
MKTLLFWLLPSLLLAQDPWKDIYKASAWEERDQWQKADQIIEHLKLKAGDQVADVGCHEGYMSFKLSAVVGKAGKVFAVDVEQNKIDRLKTNIKDRNVTNIIAVKGDYDDPKLTSAVDGVLILDTYHEMDDQDKILQKIKVALKPGGRLVICESHCERQKKFLAIRSGGKA